MANAIVEWIRGADKGKWSIVSTAWLRSHDGDTIKEGSVHVVEWRQSRKPCHGNWPAFEAKIIKIHDKVKVLEQHLRAKERSLQNDDGSVENLEKRQVKKPRRLQSDDENEAQDENDFAKWREITRPSKAIVDKKKEGQQKLQAELLAKYREKKQENQSLIDGNKQNINKHRASCQQCVKLTAEVNMLKTENETFRALLIKKIPSVLEQCSNALQEKPQNFNTLQGKIHHESDYNKYRTPQSRPSPSPHCRRSRSPRCFESPLPKTMQDAKPQMVEIFPGSGVKTSVLAYAAACNASSATVFVRTLLINLFEIPVLMDSNLKGGKSKLACSIEVAKRALDPVKIQAIYQATHAKFPDVKDGEIGKAISGKIQDLRYKARKME